MAITDLMHTLTTVTDNINTASHSSQKGVIDTTAAERLVDDAERALRDAELHLENDGQDTLRLAKEAQVKLGHQSDHMTRIASEARLEAERCQTHLLLFKFIVAYFMRIIRVIAVMFLVRLINCCVLSMAGK